MYVCERVGVGGRGDELRDLSINVGVCMCVIAVKLFLAVSPFVAYNEQVIEFLRQPDVFTRITGRYRRQLKPELKTLIETLRSVGPSGLESQSDHPQMLELIVILSLFEEEIANIQQPWNRVNSVIVKHKVKRERKKAFEQKLQKLQNFGYVLSHLGYAQNDRLR